MRSAVAAAAAGVSCACWMAAQQWTRSEQEQFLRTARIESAVAAREGAGGSKRVRLTDGQRTHEAHVQTVNIDRSALRSLLHFEPRFRDSYRHNIAASELAALVGVDNVPVSVLRSFRCSDASFTWWVDGVMLTEGQRRFRKLKPPDEKRWERQMAAVLAFDSLIANRDRNYGNLLIDREWRLWMIDHTQAFRLDGEIGAPPCPEFAGRLGELSEAEVRGRLAPWLDRGQIEALLKRAARLAARCGAAR